MKRYPRLWTAGLSCSRGSAFVTLARESTVCFFKYAWSFCGDSSFRILSICAVDIAVAGGWTYLGVGGVIDWSGTGNRRERAGNI